MVIAISIIAELRINKHLKKIDYLKAQINYKDVEIKNKNKLLINLSDSAKNLVDDYGIIRDILVEKLGVEEANRLFLDKKNGNGNTRDINDFLKQFKKGSK